MFFIISDQLSDESVSFVLFVFLQPGIFTLCFRILDKTYKNKENFINFKEFSVFEFNLRKRLVKREDSDEILTQMNQNFKLTKENLNLVLQAYYSLDFIGNCTLALNKAHWISVNSFNLYENFQIFTCKKLTKDVCKVSSTTYEFFKYFNKINKLKDLDIQFCQSYLELKSIVLSFKPNLKDYSKNIEKLNCLFQNLLIEYKKMNSRFSDSSELKEMYRTFLIDIVRDYEKGNQMIQFNNKKYFEERSLGCLSLKNQGILVLSGNIEDSGKIIFASKAFLKMIGNSSSELKDGNLDMFTPKLLEKKHPQHLARFAANSKTHITFLWITLFFVDSKGYIIECLTKIDCICVNTSIRFIAFINPLNRSREYALISKNGFIYEHSKNFTKLLMLERKYVKDNFIQDYIDIQDLKSLENNLLKLNLIQCKTKIPGSIQATCIDFSLNSTSIYILYISNTVSEYHQWNSGSNLFTVNDKTENTTEIIPKSDQSNKILQNPSKSYPSNDNFKFTLERSLYNKAKISLKAARLVLILMVI